VLGTEESCYGWGKRRCHLVSAHYLFVEIWCSGVRKVRYRCLLLQLVVRGS
jgi:hypothetical protein